MKPADVEAMAVAMRKHKLLRVRLPVYSENGVHEVEMDMSPLAFVPDVPGTLPPPGIGEAAGNPTEDQLLFASSPYPMTDEELKAKPPETP